MAKKIKENIIMKNNQNKAQRKNFFNKIDNITLSKLYLIEC